MIIERFQHLFVSVTDHIRCMPSYVRLGHVDGCIDIDRVNSHDHTLFKTNMAEANRIFIPANYKAKVWNFSSRTQFAKCSVPLYGIQGAPQTSPEASASDVASTAVESDVASTSRAVRDELKAFSMLCWLTAPPVRRQTSSGA